MKKILSAMLCVLMLLPTCVFAKDEIPFCDVDSTSWYYKELKYDYVNSLINGTSKTTFSPNATLTREQMVCMLANMDGGDLSEYKGKSSFDDVAVGAWYAPSVEWAYQNGVCYGITDKLFGTGIEITREEMACMIMNFAEYIQMPTTETSDLLQFTDRNDVSAYALDAVKYNVGAGFMNGVSANRFAPGEIATRASVAVHLYRFHYKFSYYTEYPDTAYADSLQIIEDDTPKIICWGDSLTQGLGATTPYPDLIANITGVETINMGIASETAELIAMRQGAIPVYAEAGTIPGNTDLIDYEFNDDYDNPSYIGVYGKTDRGINEISINGIVGSLFTGEYDSQFQRKTAGAALTLNKPTRIVTSGMAMRTTGDINVFFLGSNNKYAKVDSYQLVDIIDKMIRYSGTDKYVVVSLTPKCMLPDLDYTNQLLKDAYGEHYVAFREYLLTDALKDKGITPTAQDLIDLDKGEVPESLRWDVCHGNQIYYDICAQMISDKIAELGYLD